NAFFRSNIVLPNANDAPARRTEYSTCSFVSRPVLPQLGLPKERVAFGRLAMEWTAMPKTTVNEHDDFLTGEYEIGCSRQFYVPIQPVIRALRRSRASRCSVDW